MSTSPQREQKNAYLSVYAAGNFGSRSFRRLERYFGDLRICLTASAAELRAAGIRSNAVASFLSKRTTVDIAQITRYLEQNHITTLTWHDADYPALLKEITDPPPVLFVRGAVDALHHTSVAIVGSRKTTAYGERAAAHLARELCPHTISIVSGLALGIDGCAHRGALEAGGITIAVLGSGLDDASIYPRNHYALAHDILARGGALVSEFFPGTPGLPHHFPRRNRIVAGLTCATVIVEADTKSGALITARLALDYNREALAVPGSIFSLASRGTNDFIRQGATPATSAADILAAIDCNANAPVHTRERASLTDVEAAIAAHLSSEPIHINTIARLTKLDTAGLNATLSVMEIKGVVRLVGGGNYVLL